MGAGTKEQAMDMATTGQEAGELPARRTRFSDVCGTIDELKRLVHEEPEAVAAEPETPDALVADALSMLARMDVRLREYEQFRAAIVALAAALQEVRPRCHDDAAAQAAELRALLGRGRVLTEDERTEAVDRAEAIRRVAQDRESQLYRYKDLALALARAYRGIQGNRSWVLDEDEAQAAAGLPGEPPWARWLPPSPHRERILRYLRSGRAHLLPDDGDGAGRALPPLVQFEDGGVMPLPVVRWSEDVRNFYPADAPPHAHGLRYRG
jgi:hypothetical protein